VELAHSQVQRHRLAIAKYAQSNFCSGRHLADGYLERASVDDIGVVDARDDVALLQSAAACGESGVTWATMASSGFLQIEEVGIFRCDIVHADAEIAVLDLAVLDQLLGGCANDLRGNGEARAGERTAVGDDEGVDSDKFTVRVDQRAAGVAGVDSGIGLDEVAGLARIVGVGLGRLSALTIPRVTENGKFRRGCRKRARSGPAEVSSSRPRRCWADRWRSL